VRALALARFHGIGRAGDQDRQAQDWPNAAGIAVVAPDPDGRWMEQTARSLTDAGG